MTTRRHESIIILRRKRPFTVSVVNVTYALLREGLDTRSREQRRISVPANRSGVDIKKQSGRWPPQFLSTRTHAHTYAYIYRHTRVVECACYYYETPQDLRGRPNNHAPRGSRETVEIEYSGVGRTYGTGWKTSENPEADKRAYTIFVIFNDLGGAENIIIYKIMNDSAAVIPIRWASLYCTTNKKTAERRVSTFIIITCRNDSYEFYTVDESSPAGSAYLNSPG